MNVVTLSRDVPATIVPYGEQVTIPEGTRVQITHRLGGSYTVTWSGGMAQIRGEHGDALGEESAKTGQADTSTHEGPPEKDELWAALRTVYDPEIPVNIVDLGLIYSLEVNEVEGRHHVKVDMTLTAPGCGMGPAIAADARLRLEGVPGVHAAEVNIVWDPPWHQDMITEEGKMELGLI
jgi:probable FeS assembly SUF system protein SufT